jgi:hypothetical protein
MWFGQREILPTWTNMARNHLLDKTCEREACKKFIHLLYLMLAADRLDSPREPLFFVPKDTVPFCKSRKINPCPTPNRDA